MTDPLVSLMNSMAKCGSVVDKQWTRDASELMVSARPTADQHKTTCSRHTGEDRQRGNEAGGGRESLRPVGGTRMEHADS